MSPSAILPSSLKPMAFRCSSPRTMYWDERSKTWAYQWGSVHHRGIPDTIHCSVTFPHRASIFRLMASLSKGISTSFISYSSMNEKVP